MKSETKKILITILNFAILGINFLLKVLGNDGADITALSFLATMLYCV